MKRGFAASTCHLASIIIVSGKLERTQALVLRDYQLTCFIKSFVTNYTNKLTHRSQIIKSQQILLQYWNQASVFNISVKEIRFILKIISKQIDFAAQLTQQRRVKAIAIIFALLFSSFRALSYTILAI